MRNYTILKTFAAIMIFTALTAVWSKEITDDNGKICHTFKMDEKMVEFVRVRGAKVLLYKENNMIEPILTLPNKSFVQFLDRDGRNILVRFNDGTGQPVDGWLTKFNVENKNDILTFYYGEPFEVKEKIDNKVKEAAIDKIVWVTKDVAKLYYEPSHNSDYKYEIYFGLKLEAKRQVGDFYYVLIYNSIFQEYRNGWVKIEDTGAREYFLAEYNKRKVQFDKELSQINIMISEMESFIRSTGSEIEKATTDRFRLIAQKNILGERIKQLRSEKLATEDEETRKRAQEIERLEAQLTNLKKLDEEIGNEIARLENSMKRSFSDIDKNMEKANTLSLALENFRKGRFEAASSILQATPAEEAQKMIEKETVIIAHEEKAVEEDGCAPIKKKLDAATERFEKIRKNMTGQISREEYNRLYEQYMKAWTEIGELKKEHSKCETFSKNKHVALYNDALALKKEEEYDMALELLIEAVEIKEDFDEGYFQIVTILITLEDDNSIRDYIDKISDGEKKGKLYYRRALMVKDKYPGKAIRYFEKMSDTYKPELAYYYIGILYAEKLSDFASSIKYLRRSLEIDPNDPKTLEAVGAAYLELRPMVGQEKSSNYNLALSYLEKAYKNADKYNYKNTDVLNARLSQVYNLIGKASSALKHADIALQKSKIQPFGLAHVEKAKALIKMEMIKDARIHLKEALKDMSTKAEAEYLMKEIGN